jgi:flagellar motor component MotA
MFAIIGIVVVFGAIIAGYLMEHRNLKVLMQPAELVIIGGAAIGTALIGKATARSSCRRIEMSAGVSLQDAR